MGNPDVIAIARALTDERRDDNLAGRLLDREPVRLTTRVRVDGRPYSAIVGIHGEVLN